MSSSEEAAAIIQLLSKSAMQLNMSHIVSELGQAEAVGMEVPDVLDDVPEVTPVLKPQVSFSYPIQSFFLADLLLSE